MRFPTKLQVHVCCAVEPEGGPHYHPADRVSCAGSVSCSPGLEVQCTSDGGGTGVGGAHREGLMGKRVRASAREVV